jgi:RimJ/RimL family protein N-acetyltransferase
MLLDLQPTLLGAGITLRPQVASDFDALYRVAGDPELWRMHPESNRWERPVFERIFAEGLASGGALVSVRQATGELLGGSRYYDLKEATRSVAIGYTFVARSEWGRGVNSEMKRLMLDHAFGWAEAVWFYVGVDNIRSRRAVEKLGAECSHEEVRNWQARHAMYRLDRAVWRGVAGG